MRILNGEYYVEVKDHRHRIHPTENIILRKLDPPTSLRNQYKVQNETQIRKNQKKVRVDNDELIVKNYPKKKQPFQQQPNFKPPNCPACKRKNWLKYDKGYYCKNCEHIIDKQKHQIAKKIRKQDSYFSSRLPYANKKIREIDISLATTKYNSTEDVINKLRNLKKKTKLNFYKNISKYYDEMK